MKGYRHRWDDLKAQELYDMRQSGMTLEAIGKHYNISQERVRQVYWMAKRNLRSVGTRPNIGAGNIGQDMARLRSNALVWRHLRLLQRL